MTVVKKDCIYWNARLCGPLEVCRPLKRKIRLRGQSPNSINSLMWVVASD
jgi:hypothetical protein